MSLVHSCCLTCPTKEKHDGHFNILCRLVTFKCCPKLCLMFASTRQISILLHPPELGLKLHEEVVAHLPLVLEASLSHLARVKQHPHVGVIPTVTWSKKGSAPF